MADDTNLNCLRVDVIGGLRKPDRLVKAYEQLALGAIGDAELRAIQDECVQGVIGRQAALHLPVVTDGELRRRHFQESFGEAISGFDAQEGRTYYRGQTQESDHSPFHRVESGLSGAGPAVLFRRPAKERLRLVRNVPLEEFRFASQLSPVPVKTTLVGPDRVSQRFEWESSADVYSGLDEFTEDVVRIQRHMVSEMVEAGCRYVQLDEPGYTAYVDQPSLDKMRARGEDPMANLQRSIEADNAIMAGFESVTFGLHMCRGNQPRGFHREGFYDAIAEQVFGQLRCDRLLLEYDSQRAGTFEPLRFVPRDTIAVLGLISTKVTEVESIDFLQRRIEEAARYLPVERLAISPQCGFSHFGEDIQWRKLETMMETAARVWG